MLEDWQVVRSETAFATPWFRVNRDTVRLPNGLELDDYYVIHTQDFVKMFAYTQAREVVFVRQYKHGVGRVMLELPAGLIEPDEDAAEAAARELLEETGYAGELRLLDRWVHDPTRSPTMEHLFFGQVEWVATPKPDVTEEIEVVLIPAAEVPALIKSGELYALSSIAAALYCLPLLG